LTTSFSIFAFLVTKGGVTIKSIQESTGSKVQIPPSGSNMEDPSIRKISITCPTEEGALAAKDQIDKIMASKKPSTATGPVAVAPTEPQMTIEVLIPDQDVGLCIGRQGCVINELQRRSGTRINIPAHPVPGQQYRVATVSGTQEGCNHAQALIQQISKDQSSASVLPGTAQSNNQGGQRRHFGGGYQRNTYPQHNQAQQQQQHSNDPAWAAYYAAVAQQQAKQQEAAAAAPATAADTSKYEDYFRYEYYYGTEAARAYYQAYPAYCPPPDMPNPYGKNPNGVTSAPASGSASAAPQSATQAQATTSVSAAIPGVAATTSRSAVDSSVGVGMGRGRGRGVSNLPAWLVEKQRKEAAGL
jgi:KH domain